MQLYIRNDLQVQSSLLVQLTIWTNECVQSAVRDMRRAFKTPYRTPFKVYERENNKAGGSQFFPRAIKTLRPFKWKILYQRFCRFIYIKTELSETGGVNIRITNRFQFDYLMHSDICKLCFAELLFITPVGKKRPKLRNLKNVFILITNVSIEFVEFLEFLSGRAFKNN